MTCPSARPAGQRRTENALEASPTKWAGRLRAQRRLALQAAAWCLACGDGDTLGAAWDGTRTPAQPAEIPADDVSSAGTSGDGAAGNAGMMGSVSAGGNSNPENAGASGANAGTSGSADSPASGGTGASASGVAGATAGIGGAPLGAGASSEDGAGRAASCPAGTYSAESGTTVECLPCEPGLYCAGGVAEPVSCGSDTFDEDLDASTDCVAATTCEVDEYEVATPTATTDRVCAMACLPGEYVSTPATDGTEQVCTACVDGTFSTGYNADACSPWTVCTGNEYESVPGTSTSDRTCILLTECGESEYEAIAATAVTDRTCLPTTDCAPGSWVAAPPTSTADRVCEPCASGEFSEPPNAPYCSSWSECSINQVEVIAPSAVKDRYCQTPVSTIQLDGLYGVSDATFDSELGLLLVGTDSFAYLARVMPFGGGTDWILELGAPKMPRPTSVAVDGLGDILFTGNTQGAALPWEGDDAYAESGYRRTFATKLLGADRSMAWGRQVGSADHLGFGGYDGQVDANGDLFLRRTQVNSWAYEFEDLVKLSGVTGTIEWEQRIHLHSKFALAPNGDVFLMVSSPLPNGERDNLAVQRHAGSTGELIWDTRIGEGRTNAIAHSSAADSAGDLIVGGTVDDDAFVIKLAGSGGARLWSARVDFSDYSEHVSAIATDAAGDVLIAGDYQPSYAGAPWSELFVAKLSGVDGTIAWSQQFGSASLEDRALEIHDDGDGGAIVASKALAMDDDGEVPPTSEPWNYWSLVVAPIEPWDYWSVFLTTFASDGSSGDTPALDCGDACAVCGDGAITGTETCEPALPLEVGCEEFGYDLGVPTCSDFCGYDLGGCEYGFKDLDAGPYAVCGVRFNDTLLCWGDTGYQGPPPAGTYSEVAVGLYHACAIGTDGSLTCWQKLDPYILNLELDPYYPDYDFNLTVPPEGTFSQIASGRYHTCAIRQDGTLACWGACATTPDGSCQGTFEGAPTPGTFGQIDGRCGVHEDGTIATWGLDELGLEGSSFAEVSCNDRRRVCGLTDELTLDCSPDGVQEGTFSDIEVGTRHICGIHADGTLECWDTDTVLPGLLEVPSGTFEQVSSGDEYSCALRTDGAVRCWGTVARP